MPGILPAPSKPAVRDRRTVVTIEAIAPWHQRDSALANDGWVSQGTQTHNAGSTIAGKVTFVQPTFADVQAAARGLVGHVVRTPTLRSQTLSAICGCEIWLKFENLQFTSSFKDRGAGWRLMQLTSAERAIGVIAVSAGNHAQGVAHHAARLGIPAAIVMPRFTPNVKVAATQALGATVVLEGDDLAGAMAEAARRQAEDGLLFIPPFDDPWVIAGQGTCGLELFEDAPPLDAVVVPVGGGGLIAGVTLAAAALSPSTRVIGVQTSGYPSMQRALVGDPAPVPGGSTIAEGIAVARAGAHTTPILVANGVDVVTVREAQIEDAVNLLLEIEKTVSEGAGAAGLAAVLADPARFAGLRVGLIITGGNIDPRVLASIIMRGLVRSGRLSRLTVDLADLPGALSRVAAIVGNLGGNIVEVAHQRLFTDLSVKSTALELAVETRDRRHAQEMVDGLRAAGYPVHLGGDR
jgi:threonine dehydratase